MAGRERGFFAAGFTLAEVLVAAGIVVIGLTAVYVASSQCMQISQSSRNLSLANRILQERIDSLRSGSGTMLFASGSANAVTSGSLQAILSGPTFSATAGSLTSDLLRGTETVTVSDSSGSINVTRLVNAGSASAPTGAASVSSPVTVVLTLAWPEASGGNVRTISQSVVTVISNTQ